mgnify:CR=1 FL=1
MLRWRDAGCPGGLALVTLVGTHGSTYRRVGARMLVTGDGAVIRGLSGGCPQADIAERAREAMDQGCPQLVRYDLESGYDVLIEQGCGGELEVLIEPLTSATDLPPLIRARDALQQRREAGWLATCFRRGGRCPETVPRHCRSDDGDVGAVPGPREVVAIREHLAQRESRYPGTLTIGDDDWLIERLTPTHRLVVIGDNPGAQALARLSTALGWETVLITDRPRDEMIEPALSGCLTLALRPDGFGARITGDPQTSVVVMTHNLQTDIAWLEALADGAFAYLGVIGSRVRVARIHEATGLAAPRLHAPAGLDIGGETPEAIALSIAAEIQATLSGRDGTPLSVSDRPIHA